MGSTDTAKGRVTGLALLTLVAAIAVLWFWQATGQAPATVLRKAGAEEPPPPAEKPEAEKKDAAPEAPPRKVREASVAGLFYPADAQELATALDGYLEKAQPKCEGRVRALICPHAGYEFSGPVAAFGYKLLRGREFKTVLLLAPSHYADFEGVALPDEDAFRTPLGLVRVSPLVAALAKTPPFAVNPPALVEEPGWSRQLPLRLPPDAKQTPHTWEHSEEVQIPFLQRVLKGFTLVPMVLGRVDQAAVAKGLLPLIDDQTLVVASSDLSHYHPYDAARRLDESCAEAVLALDPERMARQEACGKGPILALLHIAKAKGWRPVLLDARNSGDTSGDKRRVVGYMAVAFVDPAAGAKAEPPAAAPAERPEAQYTPEDRRFLLQLARQTIQTRLKREARPAPDEQKLPKKLLEERGCFVTLTKGGDLRGCIGHIVAQEALYKAVIDNTLNAAFRDSRFDPVELAEEPDLEIEISVLTPPAPLAFDSPEDLLQKLQPHRDGVVLTIGGRSATFLPQVWEQIPEKEDFLGHLARKAGCAANAWRGKGVTVQIYHVEAFKEAELKAAVEKK
jgi:AmmeMemoRadiSam system protein B/AmmeMemoRadiSam system protein A